MSESITTTKIKPEKCKKNKINMYFAKSNEKQAALKEENSVSSNSVIPKIFRWIKKPNNRKRQFHSGRSSIEEPSLKMYSCSSTESLNFSLSENNLHNKLSIGHSKDSVSSISTTGFAYIKPTSYENLIKPKFLQNHASQYSFATQNSNISSPQLTLEEDIDFLDPSILGASTSIDDKPCKHGDFDEIQNENPIVPKRKNKIDVSKKFPTGVNLHVKGKRKAPRPPSSVPDYSIVYLNDTDIENAKSSNKAAPQITTARRKKRKAPQPPTILQEIDLKSDMNNDSSKISEILSRKKSSEAQHGKTAIGLPNKSFEFPKSIVEPVKVKEETNKENIRRDETDEKVYSDQMEAHNIKYSNKNRLLSVENDSIHRLSSKNSPISLQAWYRRSPTTSKEKTGICDDFHKIKEKQKHKGMSNSEQNSIDRFSFFDTNKLNIFWRQNTVKNLNDKMKRFSGINIPNISELDREASEILSNNAKLKANESIFHESTENIKLNQTIVLVSESSVNAEALTKTNENAKKYDEIGHKLTTLKNSIAETQTDSSKVRIDLDPCNFDPPTNVDRLSEASQERLKILQVDETEIKTTTKSPTLSCENKTTITDRQNRAKLAIKEPWICHYCTLENSNFQRICEACNNLKIFENIVTSSILESNSGENEETKFKTVSRLDEPSTMHSMQGYQKTHTVNPFEVVKSSDFESEENIEKPVNVEQVRFARLARFSSLSQKVEPQCEENTIAELEKQEPALSNQKARSKVVFTSNKNSIHKTHQEEKFNFEPNYGNDCRKSCLESQASKSGAIKKYADETNRKKVSESYVNYIVTNRTKYEIDPAENKNNKVSSSSQTHVLIKNTKSCDPNLKLLPDVQNPASNAALIPKSPYLKKHKEKYFLHHNKLPEFAKEAAAETIETLNSAVGGCDFELNINRSRKEIINHLNEKLLYKALGNLEESEKLPKDISRLNVLVKVHLLKSTKLFKPLKLDSDRNLIVAMFTENRLSQKGPVQLAVAPSMKLRELKKVVLKEYDIPVDLQNWRLNEETLNNDNMQLDALATIDDSTILVLNICSARIEDECNETIRCFRKSEMKNEFKLLSNSAHFVDPKSLPNDKEKNESVFPKFRLHGSSQNFSETPLKSKILRRKADLSDLTKNDLNKTNTNRKSTEIYNIVEEYIAPSIKKSEKSKELIGIEKRLATSEAHNPNITKNKYRGVDNFNPYRQEGSCVVYEHNYTIDSPDSFQKNKICLADISEGNKTSASNFGLKQPLNSLQSPYPNNNYLELLKLDYCDIIQNTKSFECPICLENIGPSDGVIIRECLHTFCKKCLADTIKYNEEAQVKCPFIDKDYSCEFFLQEREIKSIVTKEVYESHLTKSIKIAEFNAENAFHCKTPNCRGWCIFEDNVNEFLCPVCNLKNCLTCAAIHDGVSCKQYQDGLIDCDKLEHSRKTKEMFDDMVARGEALNCPTCQVVMMKKFGCDWLKCSMCKTEVCWVTKGSRWGPAGKGDISGGCRCGVDGIKCHPKCNYCH